MRVGGEEGKKKLWCFLTALFSLISNALQEEGKCLKRVGGEERNGVFSLLVVVMITMIIAIMIITIITASAGTRHRTAKRGAS